MNIDLKKYKKELIIVAAYILVFGVLYYFITTSKSEQFDIKADEELLARRYDSLVNRELSEEKLDEELQKVTEEVEIATGKLPKDLTVQMINQMLLNISQNTDNMFSFKDCKIGTEKSENGYVYYEVEINNVHCSYWQYKDFLNYITNYEKKICISSSDVTRNINDDISGKITVVFYGLKDE